MEIYCLYRLFANEPEKTEEKSLFVTPFYKRDIVSKITSTARKAKMNSRQSKKALNACLERKSGNQASKRSGKRLPGKVKVVSGKRKERKTLAWEAKMELGQATHKSRGRIDKTGRLNYNLYVLGRI